MKQTKCNIENLEQSRDLLKEIASDCRGLGQLVGFKRIADDIQESIDIFMGARNQ